MRTNEGFVFTMRSPSDGQMKCRYAFSVIGILVGISVALVFAVVFYNPDAAAWGLASGISIDLRYLSIAHARC